MTYIPEHENAENFHEQSELDGMKPMPKPQPGMNLYKACGIIEGFDPSDDPNDQYRAWAFLIKSGSAWSLQGFYGRGAMDMINAGIISKQGDINWDMIDGN